MQRVLALLWGVCGRRLIFVLSCGIWLLSCRGHRFRVQVLWFRLLNCICHRFFLVVKRVRERAGSTVHLSWLVHNGTGFEEVAEKAIDRTLEVCVCVYVRMHVYMYAYIYACMYACMYACIYSLFIVVDGAWFLCV